MSTLYIKYKPTGGTADALDSIPGSTLTGTDVAIVVDDTDDTSYMYRVNISSGAAESPPDIIEPDTYAGDKRWILQEVYGTGGGGGSGPGGLTGTLLDANSIQVANVTSGAIISLISPPFLLLESGSKLMQEHGREVFLEEA